MSQFAPGAGLCRCAVGHFGPRAYAACRQACSVVAGQNGSKMVGEFADTGVRRSWPRTWRSMGRHQSSASMQLASPPSPPWSQPNVGRKNCRRHQALLVARSCCRKHMVACPTRLAVDGVMKRAVAMYPVVRDVSFTRNVASLRTLFCGWFSRRLL